MNLPKLFTSVEQVMKSVKEIATGHFEKLAADLKTQFQSVVDDIATRVKTVEGSIERIGAEVDKLITTASDVGTDALNSLKDLVTQQINRIQKLEDDGAAIIEDVKSMKSTLESLLSSPRIAQETLDRLAALEAKVKSLLDPTAKPEQPKAEDTTQQ